MIILDKKIVYIKVPKAGSTTVAAAVWDHYGMERLSLHDKVVNLNFIDPKWAKHRHWHVSYKRVEAFLGKNAPQFTPFTVIREPLERIISVYRWSAQKYPDHPQLQSLEGFLEAVLERSMRLPALARLHCATQRFWLTNAKDEIDEGMQIYTLDRISECRDFFEKKLGFSPAFGWLNVSVKKPVEVNQRVKAIVNRLYQSDFELYEKHRS